MNGPLDATAVSGDTHPWGGSSSPAASITRRLLAGAAPVCCTCYRVLEPGEPRVTVPRQHPNGATLLRCCDCEYRQVHG